MSRHQVIPEPVDVCIVVEGCYPFIAGGVSSWLDWLIRNQPDLTFSVVAIWADDTPQEVKFDFPPNMKSLQVVPLTTARDKPSLWGPKIPTEELSGDLRDLLGASDVAAFDRLVRLSETPVQRRFGVLPGRWDLPEMADLLDSVQGWEALVDCCDKIVPTASFSDFFWAWRSMLGGFFSVLTAPIPPARTYHAISTGYAGLLGAVAATKTESPLLITEHGIYTNERRIDLILADWIPDMVERGLRADDGKRDVRDFWIETFEAFARVAYSKAHRVTTLYGENQLFQTALGVSDEKLAVIPNGIDLDKFGTLEPKGGRSRPCVALIGRVVPIKDIETFIIAAGHVRDKHPDVEVLILGPFGEDPAYFETCKEKVEELGLQDTVKFKGRVNILEYLEHIDVMVLTSISEAQPLVLLEAGAAQVPSVATDVGSCREIIEGSAEEQPNLGLGGRIVPPMAPEATGEAINELLSDENMRKTCGQVMKKRVEQYFTSEVSASRYFDLYSDAFAS